MNPTPEQASFAAGAHREPGSISLSRAACVLGAAAALTILLLFAVVPAVSARLHGAYNQNEYADGYDQLALNLVNGRGYRMLPDTALTTMREPGYPLLLASVFSVRGNDFAAVKMANIIMSLVTACLIMLIARRLSCDWLVVYGSPVLYLLYPGTLVAESRGGVEVMFTLFSATFVVLAAAAVRRNSLRLFVLSGVVLGATLLVRSVPILFPAVLLAYLVVTRRGGAGIVQICRNVAAMTVAMAIVLSPWVIRNYRLTNRFVPTASVVGVSAQTGLYILTHHAAGDVRTDRGAAAERNAIAQELGYPFKAGYYQYFYSTLDELRFSSYLMRYVGRQYRDSPSLFAQVLVHNAANFWIGGKSGESVDLNVLLQLPFLVLALGGIALAWRQGLIGEAALMLLFSAYVFAVTVPILAQARYSVPLVPYLSILACMSTAAALRRAQRATGDRRVAAGALSERNAGVIHQ